MLWLTWLWGNVRWEGCGPPWDKNPKQCALCGQWHGTTPHQRLARCAHWSPEFDKVWLQSWGAWEDIASRWLGTATAEERLHVCRLRIPESLIRSVPPGRMHELRYRVAWHQYHALLAVTSLRGTLTMPPRDNPSTAASRSVSAWFGAIRHRRVAPNPTDRNLREQVCYKPPQGKKVPGAPLTASCMLRRVRALLRKAPTSRTLSKAVCLLGSIPPQWREASTLCASLTRYLAPKGKVGTVFRERMLVSAARLLPLDPVRRRECEALIRAAYEDVRGLVNSIPLLGALGRNLGRFMAVASGQYMQYEERHRRSRQLAEGSVLAFRRSMVFWQGRVVAVLQSCHALLEEWADRGAKVLVKSARAVRHMALSRINEASSAALRRQQHHKLTLWQRVCQEYDRKARRPPPSSTSGRVSKRRETYDPRPSPRSVSSPPQLGRVVVRTPPQPSGYVSS